MQGGLTRDRDQYSQNSPHGRSNRPQRWVLAPVPPTNRAQGGKGGKQWEVDEQSYSASR